MGVQVVLRGEWNPVVPVGCYEMQRCGRIVAGQPAPSERWQACLIVQIKSMVSGRMNLNSNHTAENLYWQQSGLRRLLHSRVVTVENIWSFRALCCRGCVLRHPYRGSVAHIQCIFPITRTQEKSIGLMSHPPRPLSRPIIESGTR